MPSSSSADRDICREWWPWLALLALVFRRTSDQRSSVRSHMPLERDIAAVDEKIGRGDERCLLRREIDRAGRDLLRLTGAVEQMPRSVHDPRPLLAARTRARPLGEDEARRYGVGPNPVDRVIHGEDAREKQQGCRAGEVGRTQPNPRN